MKITVRDVVKELLENEYLLVEYREREDGGFDLSVRVDEEKFNRPSSMVSDCQKIRERKNNE